MTVLSCTLGSGRCAGI